MLFSEIYGSYFNAVAEILRLAVNGALDGKKMYQIVEEFGFEESLLAIPDALKSQEWPLLTDDFRTPVKYAPNMPLTDLQKRWMKSLLNDPKIKLFDVDGSGLEDAEPLFDRKDILFFDQYSDGDPFEDEEYIKNFRTVLQALREKRRIGISFKSARTGKEHRWKCVPQRLEYSLKDDKFRILTYGSGHTDIINAATIVECELLDKYDEDSVHPLEMEKGELTMELTDERNALERALLHFSHLQKETIKAEDGKYIIKLTYNMQDETEILIRILSFGPMVKVIEPQRFIGLIRQRLYMQRQL